MFGKLFQAILIAIVTIFVAGVAYTYVGWWLALIAGIIGLYLLILFVKKNKSYFGF